MTKLFTLTALLFVFSAPSWATTRYADNQLVSDCTSGNYSFSNRNCTGTDGNAYNTFAEVIAPTVAGDQICIRSGTVWTEQMDFQSPSSKSGTVGNYITVGGCNGETPTIRWAATAANSYGPIKARGARGYFIFQNLVLDGINGANDARSGWAIRDGNHHFILQNLEIKNFKNVSGIYLSANDITIRNCKIHDQQSTLLTSGTYHYAVYFHDGNNNLLEGNEFYNNAGGGMQLYPGPINNAIIRRSKFHDNNNQKNTIHIGGVEVFSSPTGGGGNITNVTFNDNWFYNNGSSPNAGTSWGLEVNTATVSNVNVFNNVFYGNKSGGLQVSGPTVGIVATNNINTGNGGTELSIAGGSNPTVTYQACTAAESCGATNKVTLTSSTQPFVNAAADDFRLIAGTNPARNAGTAVATRLSPIGVTDLGATEQGLVAAAVVAGGFIEVTVNVMTPGVLPAAGITGFTIANGTSTGTPVVTAATVKPGSNNIILLSTSGFSGSGSCTISYSGGNVRDSAFIGPSVDNISQGINSGSGISVSGTCDNSAGGTPPATNIEIHYPLDDGSGTTAADAIAANDGTLVGGVHTWLSPDGLEWGAVGTTYSPLQIPYGSGVDPKTQGFTICGSFTVATGASSMIVGGASSIGTNQRAYFGTSSGQTWQLGVYNTSYTSVVESEFPVTHTEQRVCMGADAVNDVITLTVNAVIGTSSAARRSTASMTTLAADLTVHCVLASGYCGNGLIVKNVKVWSKYLTQQEFTDDYLTYFPSGGSVGGYAEATHRWQAVYLDGSLNPINFKSIGAQEIEVVAGGAVAIEFQVDCTGGDCGPVAVRLHASDIAGNTGAVPQELNAFGLAMWRADTSSILNRGVSTCCLSGALTPIDGVTILDSVASNTIELAQDSSTMFRFIVRVATDQVGELYTLFLKQDNGADLNGVAGTAPQIRVVAPRAGTGVR